MTKGSNDRLRSFSLNLRKQYSIQKLSFHLEEKITDSRKVFSIDLNFQRFFLKTHKKGKYDLNTTQKIDVFLNIILKLSIFK